jgi:hypothetical protein
VVESNPGAIGFAVLAIIVADESEVGRNAMAHVADHVRFRQLILA